MVRFRPRECLTSTRSGLISRVKADSATSEKNFRLAKARVGVRSQLTNAAFSLNPDQVRRLVAGASCSRDRVLIRLLAETGLRRAEAVSLRRSDVDTVSRVLIIRSGKGGKLRVVPLTEGLATAMVSLAGTSEHALVFRSRQSLALSARQVNRIVAAAGRRAGVTNPNPQRRHITCHLLRHTFSRLWKASGGSIESLSKILGHSSVKTTWDLYGTESLEDIKRNYTDTIRKMLAPSDPFQNGQASGCAKGEKRESS